MKVLWVLRLFTNRSTNVSYHKTRSSTTTTHVTRNSSSLVAEIIAAIVRLVLVVGLCVAGCHLAESMNACSLAELTKRTEACKEAFGGLTNNMIVVSQELREANGVVTKLNDEMASVVTALQTSTNATEMLLDRVKAIDDRMKCVEWVLTNCMPHKLKWCYCPCCW